LISGDRLWVDDGARAELHRGSTGLRLNEHSGVQVLAIDDLYLRLELTSGSIGLRIRHLEEGEAIEISTQAATVSLRRAGVYRVSVSEDTAATGVDVRDGAADIRVGDRQQISLDGGQRGEFWASDPSRTVLRSVSPPDQFDAWGDSRDWQEDRSMAAHYVSREVTGPREMTRLARVKSVQME
jgi:hypothetical protein